jgi:RNA polymerase sigma-70 factor (ECF subfamily)
VEKLRSGFERSVLPHLPAAYNLARWLVRSDEDARDIVQESFLRAWRAFTQFRGGADARAWLLAIVRNTGHSWLRRDATRRELVATDDSLDEEIDMTDPPDVAVVRNAEAVALRDAIDRLPVELREVIVLRELEEMSYKQIADVAEIPIGTVMSRLSRARHQLFAALAPPRASLQEGAPR